MNVERTNSSAAAMRAVGPKTTSIAVGVTNLVDEGTLNGIASGPDFVVVVSITIVVLL